MSALVSNPKPDKLFKKCSVILVLSEINNFLKKLNLQVKPAETFDIVRCFAEIPSGRMRKNAEISCGRKPVLSTMDSSQAELRMIRQL